VFGVPTNTRLIAHEVDEPLDETEVGV